MEKKEAPPSRRLSGGDIARRANGRETRDSRQDAGATFFVFSVPFLSDVPRGTLSQSVY
jgi:hypothetical protein